MIDLRLSQLAADGSQLAVWPLRRWLVAGLATFVAAAAMGIPTGVIRTRFYTRMTAVTWWDYPVWAVSALMIGLLAATYVAVGRRERGSPRLLGGGILSAFAIGCNKLVVALIGVSGALNYWAPLQPVLGLISVGLLLTTFAVRLRGERSCPVAAS